MHLSIKVIPQASFDRVVGFLGPYLKVQLKGVPEKGKLNERLIDFLSEQIGIPSSAIVLKQGFTSPIKGLEIAPQYALRVEAFLMRFKEPEESED